MEYRRLFHVKLFRLLHVASVLDSEPVLQVAHDRHFSDYVLVERSIRRGPVLYKETRSCKPNISKRSLRAR